MGSWKDKFVIYTIIVLMVIVFIFVVLGLDKHSQPSIEDVMTNSTDVLEELDR